MGIYKAVKAIAVVINAVAGFKFVKSAIKREVEGTQLDGHVFTGTARMRQEGTGIDARI